MYIMCVQFEYQHEWCNCVCMCCFLYGSQNVANDEHEMYSAIFWMICCVAAKMNALVMGIAAMRISRRRRQSKFIGGLATFDLRWTAHTSLFHTTKFPSPSTYWLRTLIQKHRDSIANEWNSNIPCSRSPIKSNRIIVFWKGCTVKLN